MVEMRFGGFCFEAWLVVVAVLWGVWEDGRDNNGVEWYLPAEGYCTVGCSLNTFCTPMSA